VAWRIQANHWPSGDQAKVNNWPVLKLVNWLVCTDISGIKEYGNRFSYRPAPPATSYAPIYYQYAQTCEYKPGGFGPPQVECHRTTPPAPPTGSFSFGLCEEGGDDYTVAGERLLIPPLRPGGSIKLYGFNFITPTVTVRMVKQDEPSVRFEQQSTVFGDAVTPVKGPDGKIIVDQRIHDWIDFGVPSGHPTQPLPLPAGLYAITVLVDNVTGANLGGSAPPKLESNRLLVKIEPDVNVKFKLWSERGRCIQETWGWGGDEIWWDAFVGHIIPKQEPDGNLRPELKNTEHKEFPRGPWDDMDSGESSGPYSVDLFGPAAFELGGVVAVGVIGFEVDDEDSAKDQLQSFGAAFWKAIKAILPVVGGVAGTGVGAVILKAITVSLALYVAAAVAAVILLYSLAS
jgi:hypothetical protein